MTRRGGILILHDDGRWLLADARGQMIPWSPADREDATELSASDKPTAQGPASQLIDGLTATQLRGLQGSVVLGLPSSWCVRAGVSTQNLPRQHRRQALDYRVEESLPGSVEEYVADFPVAEPRTLAVLVRLDRLRPLVHALEAAGLAVDAVCPSVLLACMASESVADSESSGGSTRLVHVWADASQVELVESDRAGVHGWITTSPDQFRLRIGLLVAQGRARHVRHHGAEASPLTDTLRGIGLPMLPGSPDSLAQAAVRGGLSILRGKRPMVNLRSGPLAAKDPLRQVARPLTALIAAVALALGGLSAALLWRAESYRRAADQLVQQQLGVYAELFPQSKQLPVDARSRLESACRQLRGLRGLQRQKGPGGNDPPRFRGLELLQTVLTSLPRDLRYRVLELRILPDRVGLDAQARSHGDAERIAAALRGIGYLEVETPRTQRLRDDGVSLSLAARVIEAAPKGDESVKPVNETPTNTPKVAGKLAVVAEKTIPPPGNKEDRR